MSNTLKVALVTGGSSGIGLAVVHMLLEKGIHVLIASIEADGKQKIEHSLREQVRPVRAEWEYQITDIRSFQEQAKAFEKALEIWGKIDYVYANAGMGEKSPWLPTDSRSSEAFTAPDLNILDVDLTGTLYTVACAVQQFRRQSISDTGYRGKIFCTASVCGIYAIPGLPIYTAAKHAIVGFTRSYGALLENERITINAVCPNIVRTNISSTAFYEVVSKKELFTPMESMVKIFDSLLGSDPRNGCTFECGPQGVQLREPPEYMDEATKEACNLIQERSAVMHRNALYTDGEPKKL